MVENLYIGRNPKGATELIEKFNADPDSNSGIITQPKVVEVGETVTIKKGRQAILSDMIVKGDLVIEADADILMLAGEVYNSLIEERIVSLDNTTVKLTGNQTIEDVKTFSSAIVGNITGNAETATKLKTPVKINGIDFDGSSDITLDRGVVSKSANVTVNVGVSEEFTTINQALEYLSGFYPSYKKDGVIATINLKSGFVMAEQVLVSGINLGWITIVGEHTETTIDHTALTTAFNGNNYPAFGVDNGGTLPVIGQFFRFDVEKVGGNKHGLMLHGAGSSATVLADCGFIGAGNRGIYVDQNSILNAKSAKCPNAGMYGIYASLGSIVNASYADCSNAGSYGIYVDKTSTVNSDGADCSNAGTTGVYVGGASIVSAYNVDCSNAGLYGINAEAASIVNAGGAICSNAGFNGVFADSGSRINANSAIIQNQTTGNSRIRVKDGSHVEANEIDTTGGTVVVFSQAANTLTQNGIIYN